jgi:signal transduction histidine kinase
MNTTYFNKFTHEIKNPLTVCNGYLDMIMKCNEKDKETYIQIVRDEIKRTLNIISNYSNTIKKEEFNLKYLFQDIKNTLSIYKLNIIINCNNKYILGDYSKLKQVFINLIKNSYEANSSTIIINVEESTNYKISIIDNGIGIKNINDIYKDYYTTKSTGTGLGIPYSKEIIELHNGKINYYSKENIGTRVEVVLPK